MASNIILFKIIVIVSCGIISVKCAEEGKDPLRKVSKPIWNETNVDALKRDLLMSYDKFARPQHNTTKVSIDFLIKHIDFDETTSVFTIFAWFSMQWNDGKLKWNESDYGNLTRIGLAEHEIWQPDIQLYNRINFDGYFGSSHLTVGKDGNVYWTPPAVFKVLCESNLRYWPYDTHNCFLKFGSWVHSADEIDLEPQDGTDHPYSSFIENPEWNISEFVGGRRVNTYECCPEPYVYVRYNVTIERRSSIYGTVIVTPSFVIILFTLTSFWLPTGHGEKIVLNGVTALIVCIYLIYFSQKLNIMAAHTPLIVLFYSHTFFLVCLSTIISTITINLSLIKRPRPLPWIIKKHLDGILSDYLHLHDIVAAEEDEETRASEMRSHPFDEHISNDEQQIMQLHRAGKNFVKTDYLKLTTAVDRIGFIVFALIFIFFVIIYSI